MARKLFTPVPAGTGQKVRFDTASGSSTPADVLTVNRGQIPGSTLQASFADGSLPHILGPDGVSTLYQKTLDYAGNPGSPTTLAGVDSGLDPYMPAPVTPDVTAAITAAVTALINGASAAGDTLSELEAIEQALTTLVGTKMAVVVHGSTAGTARPTSSVPILWVGTVTPTNAVDNDLLVDTSGPTVKVRVSGTFTQAGGTTVAPPVPSLVGDDLVLTIPEGSVWGIDGDGLPYYDPDGAASGEEAMLVVGIDGTPAVVTIGA